MLIINKYVKFIFIDGEYIIFNNPRIKISTFGSFCNMEITCYSVTRKNVIGLCKGINDRLVSDIEIYTEDKKKKFNLNDVIYKCVKDLCSIYKSHMYKHTKVIFVAGISLEKLYDID